MLTPTRMPNTLCIVPESFGSLACIPAQIQNVNRVKIVCEVFSHAIKCHAVEKSAMFVTKRDNAFLSDPI